MNPDDEKSTDTVIDISGIDYSKSTQTIDWVNNTYVSYDTMNFDFSNIPDDYTIAADGHGIWINSPTFVLPEYQSVSTGDDPETCLSNKQQEMHAKFPSLDEAWKNYQLIYKLVKGKEPGEDVI